MRIGLIIYGSLDILSGGYLYDRKLVVYLRNQGHDVAIFSQPQMSYRGRLSHNFSLKFARQIQAYQPDILLQDELNHPSLFMLNRFLRKQISCPFISIVHHLYTSELGLSFRKPFLEAIEKHYLAPLDGFIFNSNTTKQVVENLIGPVSHQVVALPGKDNVTLDIDEAFIHARVSQERPLQIIFVGNVTPRKSLHLLVKGFAKLALGQAVLKVVGNCEVDPDYVAQVKASIHQQGLDNVVQFLGKVPDDVLADTLRSGDILAVPSSYEGFGIVYVEALGAGLPVIAGNRGGSQEIVQTGQNGFLVSQDENDIAAALNHVLDKKDGLAQMSVAALQRYKQFPTWAESMARICDFLETF
ncbi:MAG: glycosyltransferase family 4 protein [Chloroflexota bacterium]